MISQCLRTSCKTTQETGRSKEEIDVLDATGPRAQQLRDVGGGERIEPQQASLLTFMNDLPPRLVVKRSASHVETLSEETSHDRAASRLSRFRAGRAEMEARPVAV